MRVFLAWSLFLFVTGIEANAQLDPGDVTQANQRLPMAGVNRLVPLAGSGRTSSIGSTAGPGGSSFSTANAGDRYSRRPQPVDSDVAALQPIPDPNMQLPAPTSVERPVFGPIAETCPPCQLELRFGIGGSSDPGRDDI